MRHIRYIVKKDLRQTWMWVLAMALSLAGLGWAAYMTFHAPPPDRNLWANALTGLAVATLVSTAVFLAILVHSESLCGTRAHWLGRPIDWRVLLAAKSLFALTATALPVALLMTVFLAAEGFSPSNHLPEIAWRTAIVLATVILPIAALATVTNNLQQMALWLVGLFVAFLLAASLLHGRGGDSNIASLALITLLGAAISIWQYATRAAPIARLALAAGVPLVLALQGLPTRATASAPVPALTLDAPRSLPNSAFRGDYFARQLLLPVRITGISDTELATLGATHQLEIDAAGERMAKVDYIAPTLRRAGTGNNYWLQIPIHPAFAQRHVKDPLSIRLRAQMTLYGNRLIVPITTTPADIPGLGRCHAEADVAFKVRCTAPFRIRPLLELFLTGPDPERALSLQVHEADLSPLDLETHPIPVERFIGYVPTGHDLLPTERIELSIANPRANIETELTLTGLRLQDYVR
jgi:hypothetical protein